MRHWFYKCNARDGGPSGYSGDWLQDVFSRKAETEWGGHYSTKSAEVGHLLDRDVAAGDLVVAYQTDLLAVVGLCTVTKIAGRPGNRKLYVEPLLVFAPPFKIHDHKAGTPLATSPAVNGPVMLRELDRVEARLIITMANASGSAYQEPPR